MTTGAGGRSWRQKRPLRKLQKDPEGKDPESFWKNQKYLVKTSRSR